MKIITHSTYYYTILNFTHHFLGHELQLAQQTLEKVCVYTAKRSEIGSGDSIVAQIGGTFDDLVTANVVLSCCLKVGMLEHIAIFQLPHLQL